MVEKSSLEDVLLLNVREGINHSEMVDIRNAISDQIREGHVNVIISLEDVESINYLSLGVLVERLMRLRSCGGDLKFVGMNNYLRNAFKLIGIEGAIENFGSIADAKRSFSKFHSLDRKDC